MGTSSEKRMDHPTKRKLPKMRKDYRRIKGEAVERSQNSIGQQIRRMVEADREHDIR